MAHLTNHDRDNLEFMLKSHYPISKIARELHKSCSTITREIIKHSKQSDKVLYNRSLNCCEHRMTCTKKHICSRHLTDCRKIFCKFCKFCNSECKDFVETKCSRLSAPPYVCNGCEDERKCTLKKLYYVPDVAHKEYRATLVEARSGVNLTETELLHLDKLYSPLLINGQSVHHIFASNPNNMVCSEKSVYRYVKGNLLKARSIDLPRLVKMKPRKTKPVVCKIDKKCFIGRTYNDYEVYLLEHPGIQVVEMDTVEGVKGGKVLLTLHLKGLCDFMLAYIRDYNTAQSVIDIFDNLYSVLKPDLFKKLFGCALTDRGTEFTNPVALETAPDGTVRTRIFYCNPQASWQKPNVELNHEFIRRILPKGYSFNHLDQNDINLMMDHINSYGREKLNDKCPIEALSSLYGQDVLGLLNIRKIPANEIILHPKLLKK